MKMINILIKEVNNDNEFDLSKTIINKIMCDENKEYYRNAYYLFCINNNLVAGYVNQKKIIHIVLLDKSSYKTEFILKDGQLKNFDTIYISKKKIIDMAINKELFFNKAEIENIEIN